MAETVCDRVQVNVVGDELGCIPVAAVVEPHRSLGQPISGCSRSVTRPRLGQGIGMPRFQCRSCQQVLRADSSPNLKTCLFGPPGTQHRHESSIDEIVVRLACEQVDELVSLRRSAAQLKRPELRLRYLRAVQDAEKSLLQTVSALGFTPTARAKLGLVVAQAAETQTRLRRFTDRGLPLERG